MCEWSPLYAEYLKHHSIICTFAHLHIDSAFAHSRICTLTTHYSIILTFAHLHINNPMQLKRLVIHCTATPEGREVTAADIRHWHCDPVSKGGHGWKQVGYTDLIHLDGRIERLVKNNEDLIVDPWEVTNGASGYNATSRHIVYAGGCDKQMRPKDTRTAAQRTALEAYVKDFHRRFPTVQIVGHNQLNPSKACPSFDVKKWLNEIGVNLSR